MDLKDLIERIAFIRIRANLSARKLSLMIGKTDGYIHHLEQTRKFAPSFETLMEILDACNTSVEEFFYHDIASYKTDMQILELLQRSTPERKAIVLDMLKVR